MRSLTTATRLVLFVASAARACRFVIYLGAEEMDASELLLWSPNNLVTMSRDKAIEHTPGAQSSPRWNLTQFGQRNVDENLDGWGVSWYVNNSDFPRRVRSAAPVADEFLNPHGDLVNLLRGSDLIPYMATNDSCVSDAYAMKGGPLRSRTIVGHVRAASTGKLDKVNSHPFVFNTLTWVHNGAIASFELIRDRLFQGLDESITKLVAGQTDSETAAAAFLDKLRGFPSSGKFSLEHLRNAMRTILRTITEANAEFGDSNSLNFGVTDGEGLVVSRYRSNPREDPPTLYYKLIPEKKGIIVASEPLENDPTALLDWTLIGKDRILSFSPEAGLQIECVDLPACDQHDTPAATLDPISGLVHVLP